MTKKYSQQSNAAEGHALDDATLSVETATKIVADALDLLDTVEGIEEDLSSGTLRVRSEEGAFTVDVRPIDHGASLALADENGGVWGSHPNYPVADWQIEVENHDTRLGYWDWVAHEIEVAGSSR